MEFLSSFPEFRLSNYEINPIEYVLPVIRIYDDVGFFKLFISSEFRSYNCMTIEAKVPHCLKINMLGTSKGLLFYGHLNLPILNIDVDCYIHKIHWT